MIFIDRAERTKSRGSVQNWSEFSQKKSQRTFSRRQVSYGQVRPPGSARAGASTFFANLLRIISYTRKEACDAVHFTNPGIVEPAL